MSSCQSCQSRFRTSLLACTALAGLLIWAKLRLVTNFPRTVIADPKQSEQADLSPQEESATPARDPENE
ncbi:MAG: hypothetical protein D6695_01065 [Planctomycetota bacterium]|nr:MAG: hypothetical protein D6695_01065 [Planctomycetota bacterium]